MTLLAVIPARAGSKGIPGKALRTVGGVPMILRTLRTVEESGAAERIVVSTDWPELRAFCELRGFEVLDRPAELATDDAPLSVVAKHAVEALDWKGTVGLFQSTCPLLSADTIREAVKRFKQSEWDWAITAHTDPHIHWRDGYPLDDRVNRQLDEAALFRESGAIQLMSAEYALTGHAREVTIGTLPIPAREALDVDGPDDLLLVERLAGLRRIHFVVAVGHEVGTGHYHRCAHLARVLSHHDLSWEWDWHGDPPELQSPVATDRDGRDADVTIFDRLAVPLRHLLDAKAHSKVVVLEDAEEHFGGLADLRVNEMLDTADLRYTVLREEFACLPARNYAERGRRVLISFGGTDPAGLTGRLSTELHAYDLNVIRPGKAVSMAWAMRDADLIVTGQGRTVFEAAACGTPCISIAANEREARHVRIPGVTYLGLHAAVPSAVLYHAVRETLESQALREEMARTARANFDDRGADRLARAIEELML